MPRAAAISRPRARRPARAAGGVLLRRRVVALAILILAVIGGYMFWLRDSSLVAVKSLTVNGATGPDAPKIKAALARAAGDMTTLHLRYGALDRAVRPYPVVQSISAKPSYPNGLVVELTLRRPALVLDGAGKRLAVAADGTLLRGMGADSALPVLDAPGLPGGRRLTGDLLSETLVIAGFPRALRPYFAGGSVVDGGVRVKLKNGPELRFGDGTDTRAKWAAALRVLSDPQSKGAGYVDVSAPRRPAVGGIVQPSTTPQTAPAGAGA